jgi:predicted O-methyltransferase YrrM
MLQERWDAVDDYIGESLVPADPVLEAALLASADAGLPPISVSPSQGKLLHVLARAQGARADQRDRYPDRRQQGI